MKNAPPTRSNVVVLKQILNLIPRGMINRHALETGVEAKARTFSVLSHLSAMLFAQLSHAIGLNDVCDWLRLKSGVLARFGITPPSKNGLSNANMDRNSDFAEKLFWSVLGHLQHASPDFAAGRKGKGLLRRFKVKIHAVNSTVIQLVANCMDWAKHRRRKAAAKMHLRLDLHSFLPSFAIVDTAKQHDNKRAREVCANIAAGEIVVFDKAYVDFEHLFDLDHRGVWWVTRAKDNMVFRVVKNHTKGRWDIEVFFKQVKQSLKLGSFLGHSANAVRWQIFTALLVYVLLRFMAHLSEWGHGFTRLFTVTRSALWERIDLLALLKSYGTESGRFKVPGALNTAWLPGFAPAKT